MVLLLKQRLFSWFDSYDILDEEERVVYTVQGRLAWGHRLEVHAPTGELLATLQQHLIAFLPRFDIEQNGRVVGQITKEFTLFHPSFSLDCNGWRVEGNFWEWDYEILAANGQVIASIHKELFNFTDTYFIRIAQPADSLMALMVVLAIDAVKCSQN